MKKTAVCLVLFLVVLMSYGCGSDAGKAFVGTWVNEEREVTVVINHNDGKSYIVEITEPNFFRWNENDPLMSTEKFPAVLEDNILKMNIQGFPLNLMIDKNSGMLLDGQSEYVKVKK